MNQGGFKETRRPEGEPDFPRGAEGAPRDALDETRGIDLGGLLGSILGTAGEGTGGEAASDSLPAGALNGLLGALIGGGDAVSLESVATTAGISQSAVLAIVPLVAGALLGQGHEPGATRAALDDLAEGRTGAADALAGTGLLQEIMRRTGLSQKGALSVIMAVLKALGLGKTTTSAHSKPKPKPKPRPKPSAKPKPRPKPSASTAAKPKPKPKPSSHTATGAKPKPKPKPIAHATSARPKPRHKRSGEVGESSEESTGDSAG